MAGDSVYSRAFYHTGAEHEEYYRGAPAVVDLIIALSILFVAVENLLLNELKPWRILLVFMFGLIHGMGFASALNEIGSPRGKFYTSILSFNLGVEFGQIAVIPAVFSLIIIPFRNKQMVSKIHGVPYIGDYRDNSGILDFCAGILLMSLLRISGIVPSTPIPGSVP